MQFSKNCVRNEYSSKKLREDLNYIDEKQVVNGRTVRNDNHPTLQVASYGEVVLKVGLCVIQVGAVPLEEGVYLKTRLEP